MTRSRALRGFTFLEVVIALVIVSIMVLAMAAAMLPSRQTTAEVGIGVEMDSQARAFLADVRRDVRASGYKRDSSWMVTSPGLGASATTLTFRKRLGQDDTNSVTGWSPTPITYARVGDGTYSGVPGTINRFKIDMTKDGVTSTRLKNVAGLTFTHISAVGVGTDTIVVRLEVLRPNPIWNTGNPPQPFRRVYEDRIQTLNEAPPP